MPSWNHPLLYALTAIVEILGEITYRWQVECIELEEQMLHISNKALLQGNKKTEPQCQSLNQVEKEKLLFFLQCCKFECNLNFHT